MTNQIVQRARADVAKAKSLVPALGKIIEETIQGEIWERPQLTKRDRSMITVAALVSLRPADQILTSQMARALDNGVAAVELREMLTHLAFYAGCPAALSAALVLERLLDGLGLLPETEG